MKMLCVIPARGGSKRVPKKNIRSFLGRPILHYPIAAALESGIFGEVMVSTDDPETAEIARAGGAEVPFMRSPSTADDRATVIDALFEVFQEYEKKGNPIENFCCLFPTAVFVTPELLRQAQGQFSAPGIDSLVTVTRFGFPIQRALKVQKGKLALFQPEHFFTRSQDLEPAYHDAGQFFMCQVSMFKQARRALSEQTAALIVPESQCQDIDNEEDWKMAEIKFQKIRNGG